MNGIRSAHDVSNRRRNSSMRSAKIGSSWFVQQKMDIARGSRNCFRRNRFSPPEPLAYSYAPESLKESGSFEQMSS